MSSHIPIIGGSNGPCQDWVSNDFVVDGLQLIGKVQVDLIIYCLISTDIVEEDSNVKLISRDRQGHFLYYSNVLFLQIAYHLELFTV